MGMHSALQKGAWVIVFCATGLLFAQPGNEADKQFVKHAMEDSNSEIKVAHLVLEKSQSQDVKQFAQRMITDHSKLNRETVPIARDLSVTPPTQGTPDGQALEQKLQPLSGKELDDAYIKAEVLDHTKGVIAFKQEATDGSNPQVKQAAEQGLQVIQQHLQMAKQLAQDHHVQVPARE